MENQLLISSGIWLGASCAFMSSVTWAIGSTIYSSYSKVYSPFSINLMRGLFALPLFIACELLVRRQGILAGSTPQLSVEIIKMFAEVPLTNYFWLFFSMISSYGIGDACFFISCNKIGVSTALAIASSYPLWVAAIGAIFLGQFPGFLQWIGMIIVLLGVGLVILNFRTIGTTHSQGLQPSGQRFDRSIGIALAVLTSLFWALNSFSVAKGGSGLSPFLGNAIRMTIAIGLCMFFLKLTLYKPFLFLRGGQVGDSRNRQMTISFKVLGWRWLVFAGEAFGGSLVFVYGLSHAPLAVAGTLSSLAPVLAVPFGLWMGIEKFSFQRFFGICLVVLGTFCLLS